MFRKLNVSLPVQRWMKISILIVGLLFLFHLLSKFSGFLFMAIGYCIGCVINAIHEYLFEQYKLKCFDEVESKFSSKYNNENEVIENDVL